MLVRAAGIGKNRSGQLAALGALAAASCLPASPTDSPQYGRPAVDYEVISFSGGKLRVRLAADRYNVAEWITNEYAIPVTITVDRTEMNLHATVPPITTGVLVPHTPWRGAVWDIVDPDSRWNEQSVVHTEYGDPSASAKSYLYALPFPIGETHRVIQGFNSTFTHSADEVFAIDFEMPEGTIVRAARDGTVVAFNDRATGHGLSPEYRGFERANWIIIQHDDGTLGQYLHLAAHGVRVSVGQHVARGAVLGLSGFTGYTSRPHLHFVVSTAVNGMHMKSFWFAFKGSADDNVGTVPLQGQAYTAFE